MTTWKNLAPDLTRQRIVIELTTDCLVPPAMIRDYLSKLADNLAMEIISGPFAYSAHEMGFGGWVHWKTSGAHVYSYPTTPPLATVDIYTCKEASVGAAVEFTKQYFQAREIVFQEVLV